LAKRNYECMFVLNSGKYASDPNGAEANLKELLDRVAAELVVQSPWQDGKLAYPIKGHRKGTHYLMYFRMDGSQMDEMTRLCKLNDLILRHMVIEHSDTLFDAMSQALIQHGKGESGEGEPEVKAEEPRRRQSAEA
jgi:small subunit ribosomal protein S6